MTTPPPVYNSRNLPAPWAECEVCGSTHPALPDLDGSLFCPDCAHRQRLGTAADAHLAQLLAPVLGAWAHHYTAQGAAVPRLYTALMMWTGGDLNERAQAEHLSALLTDAMREHTPPSFTPAPPDRVQLDARTLPQLLAFQLDETRPAADGPGQIDRRLTFTVRNANGAVSERLHLSPGCDAVLILNTNPEHDALLIYTGFHGQTDTGRGEALRVPARLLPQVRAALGCTFTTWGAS